MAVVPADLRSSVGHLSVCNLLKVPREHEVLRAAYQILLTLPVTNASVEKSFSKLSHIKSKLRTTMSQERLEALMLCAVEKDLLIQDGPKNKLLLIIIKSY